MIPNAISTNLNNNTQTHTNNNTTNHTEFLLAAIKYFEEGIAQTGYIEPENPAISVLAKNENFQKAAEIFFRPEYLPGCPLTKKFQLYLLKIFPARAKEWSNEETVDRSKFYNYVEDSVHQKAADMYYSASIKFKDLQSKTIKQIKNVQDTDNGPLLYLKGHIILNDLCKKDDNAGAISNETGAENYFMRAIKAGEVRGILGLSQLTKTNETVFTTKYEGSKVRIALAKIKNVINRLNICRSIGKDEIYTFENILNNIPKDQELNSASKAYLERYFILVAAQFGSRAAQMELVILSMNRQKGILTDEKALFWIQQIAEKGDLKSIRMCADLLEGFKSKLYPYPKKNEMIYNYRKLAAYHPEASGYDFQEFGKRYILSGKNRNLDDARKWYEKAYAMDPKNSLYANAYIKILQDLGEHEKAMIILAEKLEEYEELSGMIEDMGKELKGHKKASYTLEDIEEDIKKSEETSRLLGDEIDQYNRAISFLEKKAEILEYRSSYFNSYTENAKMKNAPEVLTSKVIELISTKDLDTLQLFLSVIVEKAMLFIPTEIHALISKLITSIHDEATLAKFYYYLYQLPQEALGTDSKIKLGYLKKTLSLSVQPDDKTIFFYGVECINNGLFQEALEYLQKLSKDTIFSALSLHALGTCYYGLANEAISSNKDLGEVINLEKQAFAYFSQFLQVKKELPELKAHAAYSLAKFYIENRAGLPPSSDKKIVHYLELAAQCDIEGALNTLGVAYCLGSYGLPVDTDKAKVLFSRGIEMDSEGARLDFAFAEWCADKSETPFLKLQAAFERFYDYNPTRAEEVLALFNSIFPQSQDKTEVEDSSTLSYVDESVLEIADDTQSLILDEDQNLEKTPVQLVEESFHLQSGEEMSAATLIVPDTATKQIASVLKPIQKQDLSKVVKQDPLKEKSLTEKEIKERYMRDLNKLETVMDGFKKSHQGLKSWKLPTLIGDALNLLGGEYSAKKKGSRTLTVGKIPVSGFHNCHKPYSRGNMDLGAFKKSVAAPINDALKKS
jgi:TPR repeat protein